MKKDLDYYRDALVHAEIHLETVKNFPRLALETETQSFQDRIDLLKAQEDYYRAYRAYHGSLYEQDIDTKELLTENKNETEVLMKRKDWTNYESD